MRDEAQVELVRSADGLLVAEVDYGEQGCARDVQRLVAVARSVGADAVWIHARVIDADLGFVRRGGYARFEAPRPPEPVELPLVPPHLVRELELACFAGVWGVHEPTHALAVGFSYVGLHEDGDWIGICRFDVEHGRIERPGVLPQVRTPDRFARLVRGAGNLLDRRPVTLETWGDDEETRAAYAALGFAPVESVPGWELRL
jgi:hypothetical protein